MLPIYWFSQVPIPYPKPQKPCDLQKCPVVWCKPPKNPILSSIAGDQIFTAVKIARTNGTQEKNLSECSWDGSNHRRWASKRENNARHRREIHPRKPFCSAFKTLKNRKIPEIVSQNMGIVSQKLRKKKCCSGHNFIAVLLHDFRTSVRWWWKKSRCHFFMSGISSSIALVIVSTFVGKSCLCSYHKPKLLPFFINIFSNRLRRFLYDHCSW